MGSPEESQTPAERVAEILTTADALPTADILTSFLLKTVETPFVDIDRVWHSGDLLKALVDVLVDAFSTWGLDEPTAYDTIVTASSAIAAYGAIPIAGALAARLGKRLCVLPQLSRGQYTLYPSTLSWRTLLAEKDVLILQDAMVYGRSVARIAQLVSEHNARLTALVVLVDQEPANRQLPEALRDVPLFSLLTGQKLAELIGNS